MFARLLLFLLSPLPCLAAFTSSLETPEGRAWATGIFRESLANLEAAYPDRFEAAPYLAALAELEHRLHAGDPVALQAFEGLKREAFSNHPLLRDRELLAVRIPVHAWADEPISVQMYAIGQMETHLSLSSMPEEAPAGSIVRMRVESPAARETLVPARDGEAIAGLDLHWDAQRYLFSKRVDGYWEVFEQDLATGEIRQISHSGKDAIDSYDAAYLPSGKIVFGSDAPVQGVPCWHGVPNRVANLYVMNADGEQVRQLCYDQGHNAQPHVLRDGRVIFNRWDYTGMNRVFNQFAMQMRPDGTNQRSYYGTNTWWPNGTFAHRELPGSNRLVCVIAGYHGTYRSGYLGILDPSIGDRGEKPVVKVITGTPQPAQRIVADRWMKNVYPKFTDPWPIDDQYFLASVLREPGNSDFAICLVDVLGNITPLVAESDVAFMNAVLLEERPLPHRIPEQVDLRQDHATVFIQDVYRGPGLKGVPRGTAKKIRVIGYDYGYPTLAGVDKIGMSGPWEVVQILGEAPIHEDGSAYFKMPADTPVAFQVVDDTGQAIQLMRTWTTAMAGERLSCIGCHESSNEVASRRPSLALQSPARELEPWKGPARGFDFAREIQPVLNQNCVGCHDGQQVDPDLRPASLVPGYQGPILSFYDRTRLNEAYKEQFGGEGRVNYSPAYEALVDYIRRVGAGDGVSLPNPGEYSANTSPLIQILRKGHYGVQLSDAELERFYTWIDLNGAQHGSWLEVYGMPPAEGGYEKRYTLREHFGSKQQNLDPQFPPMPEPVLASMPADAPPLRPRPTTEAPPFRQSDHKFKNLDYREIEVVPGQAITLVRIPSGEVSMGSEFGYPDERPVTPVAIESDFWMSETEVTNALFKAFREDHDSGYLQKRHDTRPDDKGVALNRADQPVVRVSWEEAVAYCKWLTEKTGIQFSLPTEAQWEYASRAGSNQPFFFGGFEEDFSSFANLADASFAFDGVTGRPSDRTRYGRTLFMTASDLESLHTDLVHLSEIRSRDGFIGTAPVDQFESNPYGLKNMIGNVAEWTQSAYQPHSAQAGTVEPGDRSTERVVRGGSFSDAPKRATASTRLPYPQWQRVYNVGFRVVANSIP